MASIATVPCANCGAPATSSCAQCKDGYGYHGNPSVETKYCSKDCQIQHWTQHYNHCNASGVWRKHLFRAGSLLQEVFYMFREATFATAITKFEYGEGDVLHVYQTARLAGQILAGFPYHEGLSEAHKKALLVHLADIDALVHSYNFGVRVLEDIGDIEEVTQTRPPTASRIVFHRLVVVDGELYHDAGDVPQTQFKLLKITLKNGDAYALDLTSAQFGDYPTVMPWSEHETTFNSTQISQSAFGTVYDERRDALAGPSLSLHFLPGSDLRITLVQTRVAIAISVGTSFVMRFPIHLGVGMMTVAKSLQQLPQEWYELHRARLIFAIGIALQQCLVQSLKDAETELTPNDLFPGSFQSTQFGTASARLFM